MKSILGLFLSLVNICTTSTVGARGSVFIWGRSWLLFAMLYNKVYTLTVLTELKISCSHTQYNAKYNFPNWKSLEENNGDLI
jgi:hypothetical protein